MSASMGNVLSDSSCLRQSTKHRPLHFPTANMQISGRVFSSGARCAQVIIQRTRTPASPLPVPVAANDTLANVDRSVCFCGDSNHQKVHNFSWHRPPELKISRGRLPGFVTALLSSLLHAAENSCSSSRRPTPRTSHLRRQKIFWWRSF